jgi:hypothetical protein
MNFWINCQVHYQFQVFINQLETFYLVCGKGKQNATYAEIANLCDAAYELLFQANIPKEDPGPTMASISGGLQTQLEILVDTKEGNENSDLFTKHHGNTKTSLKEFTLIFKDYLKQYHIDPDIAKNSFKEMSTMLIPLEQLQTKIQSLRIHRQENNDPITLFKRSGRYSPKLMFSAGALVSASVFIAILSIIDHTIGPAIDNYLDEKIERKVDYKDLLSLLCLSIAICLFIYAFIKNYRFNPSKAEFNNIKDIDDIRVIELEDTIENKNYTERSMLLN